MRIMDASALEKFLHQQIPISQTFGVQVLKATKESVILKAPLSPNINHLGTAFGGSLASVAILAGYSWAYHVLFQRGYKAHIILKSSVTDYMKPVQGDFTAECKAPPEAEIEAFFKAFEKKGRARIHLESKIVTAAGAACVLRGEFVAQRVFNSENERS